MFNTSLMYNQLSRRVPSRKFRFSRTSDSSLRIVFVQAKWVNVAIGWDLEYSLLCWGFLLFLFFFSFRLGDLTVAGFAGHWWVCLLPSRFYTPIYISGLSY